MSEQTEAPSTRIFPAYLIGYVIVAALVVVAGSFAFPPLRTLTGAKTTDAIVARLAPVARVEFMPTGAATHTLRTGEAVYSGLCVACHGTGAAGSPKFGDKKAWAPRIAQGFDTLVKHATEGYKTMPPKGGDANLDPQEVARAVAYMADQGGATFKEP
jgi:cytochrome c5